MDYLPLFHNLKGRRCLVVGGGDIALRKCRLLAAAGSEIDSVALDYSPEFTAFANEQRITMQQRGFQASDIDRAALVIAATSDEQLNTQISQLAKARDIPVNVVDNPALCSVVFPSIVDRSPVQIAIGTGGTSPVLARLMRRKLESLFPAAYGRLAQLAGQYRQSVKQKLTDEATRKAFWEQVFEGPVAERVFSGQQQQAERLLEQQLQSSEDGVNGEVYLVGAGPGDPDLLTFKALRLMQQADIVLYDRLVSKEVRELVRRDADLVYVGKKEGDHPVNQDNINQKLVDFAKQGHRVLRLKGGDPFIFGRGGEEIAFLADNNIPFQVVPGITAASGCASYAGIPLTHRDHAQSVRFITGHSKDGKLNLAWPELVMPNQTLVFYMGLNGLETICRELMSHGLDKTTPAALIEKGTSYRQRVFVSDLANLPEKVRASNAKAPTLIIIGHVVQLHHQLAWFNKSITPDNKES